LIAAPAIEPPDSVVENYLTATRQQEKSLEGASMDVEIEASLPKLKKHGRFHALRRILPLGVLKYEKPRYEGDNIVYKEVIARYLTAEVEAQKAQSPADAVTPDNYKFKFKGLVQLDGRDAYLYQVTPRQKREHLFKGELWIDTHTYLRLQESGYLVRNPSVLFKKVVFLRKYEIRDGISVPLQQQSVAELRLVGKAELNIDFSNLSLDPKRAATGEDAGQ
jgi:hypothetical protein